MEETSKDVINKFLGMFGHPEWNIEHFWNNSKRRITAALSPSNSREGTPEPDDDDIESDQTHDNLVQSVQILEGEPSNKKRRSNI